MSVFGQSVEDSDRFSRVRALMALLRRGKDLGFVHFRRNDGGIEVGCTMHEGWEIQVRHGAEWDGAYAVQQHLYFFHQ